VQPYRNEANAFSREKVSNADELETAALSQSAKWRAPPQMSSRSMSVVKHRRYGLARLFDCESRRLCP
jgi:hypothetical protein